MNRRPLILVVLMGGLLAATPLRGEEPRPASPNTPADKAPVVSMTVSPADEPSPALRYRLVATFPERHDGNAAIFYYRAILSSREITSKLPKEWENAVAALDKPMAELPREEIRKLLNLSKSAREELQMASRCDHCRWDLRMRDRRGIAVVGVVLPEWQELRQLARWLALEARLAIADGRTNDALESLRIGYQLAQDAAEEPLLICGLVGIACGQLMNQQLLELMQLPEAPNLYWALASLRRPLIDLQPAMEYEMTFVTQIFPVLRDAETAQRSPADWDRALKEITGEMKRLIGNGPLPGNAIEEAKQALEVMARIAQTLPEARKRLIARGLNAEKVAAMPDSQAILIDAAQNYFWMRDEMFKNSFLPYSEAYPRMQEVEARLTAEGWLGPKSREPLLLASTLLAAVSNAKLAEVRMERTLAELRLIEALRMHASRNNGQWPASLDDVTCAPLPVDPLTGKRFPYRVESGTAIIEVTQLPGKGPVHGKTYRVALRTK